MVLTNRWTAWNKSSFTGTPGKRSYNLSAHLQQLPMHIPSILVLLLSKQIFKLANIGHASSILSVFVNRHWITWPTSFKTHITDLYCLIHLPSLFPWKPRFAAALNVWSQLIQFCPYLLHILLDKSLRFEKRRYIYLSIRIFRPGLRLKVSDSFIVGKVTSESLAMPACFFAKRKCFFSVSKSMSVLGSNKVFCFLDSVANLY